MGVGFDEVQQTFVASKYFPMTYLQIRKGKIEELYSGANRKLNTNVTSKEQTDITSGCDTLRTYHICILAKNV